MIYERVADDRWSYRDAYTKDYTHCYHNYPAMMIPQIVRALIEEYRPEGRLRTLLDPYMGSGTSLVEASIAGIDSVGIDVNPLACLISDVKTRHYDLQLIERSYRYFIDSMDKYTEDSVVDTNFDRISNNDYWYSRDVLLRLSYLTQLIDEDAYSRDFFRVALSEVVREASFTRNGEFKRFRMPQSKISLFHPDVFEMFRTKALRNMKGLQQYNLTKLRPEIKIYMLNTSYGIPVSKVGPETIDMVITSPPYGDSRTTVAYGQFSRWSNEWFGFDNARNLDNLLMGGHRYDRMIFETESIKSELDLIKTSDAKRFWDVVSFLNDYWLSIRNVAEKVRRGGVVCYVVGNRTVKGVRISLDYFTAEMFAKCGFDHIRTIVRGIPNKRMPAKTSPSNIAGDMVNTMLNEYIVIMRKL